MSKPQNIIKVFLIDRPRIHLTRPSTTSSPESYILISILVLTTALAAVLQLIPYEQTGRYRVPKVFFKGQASAFHAFIVCIMFAFSGAFSALFVHNRPNMARLCRYYSMASMASAVGLLMFASFSREW